MIRLYKGDNIKVIREIAKKNKKYNIVYLDPPYNTKNGKLTFKDNLGESNNWYNFFKDRIEVINNVLDTNAVVYVSIGHEELAYAKLALDKILGKKGFIAIMPRITNIVSKTTKTISRINDFLLIYKKGNVAFNGVDINKTNYKYSDSHLNSRGKYQIRRLDYKDFSYSKSLDFPVSFKSFKYFPKNEKTFLERRADSKEKDWCWLWSRKKIEFAIKNDFVEEKNGKLFKKTYTKCEISKEKGEYYLHYYKRTKPFSSLEFTKRKYANTRKKNDIEKMFSYPKAESLIEFLFDLPIFNKKKILDPFAGSGVSALVASKRGFDCDLVQISEPIRQRNLIYINGYKNVFDLTKAILNENEIEAKIYE